MGRPCVYCSLARRLAAAGYDCLLLAALWVAATLLILAFRRWEAIPSGSTAYSAFLVAVAWLYFAFQWTHGGRTLGMKAWRIVLRRRDGDAPRWTDATVRFFAAILAWLPLGAGFLWALLDRDCLALHDRMSGTVLARDDGERQRTT